MPPLPILTVFAFTCVAAATSAPFHLRVDLHQSTRRGDTFVTLDALYPLPNTPLLLSWALPSSLPTQASYRVWITTPTSATANATVLDSGFVASSAPRALVPRSLLAPARGYSWTVAVKGGDGAVSAWAAPQRFFTSGGNATWAASAPIWAPPCAGAQAPPPKFARFHAAVPLPAGRAVLSALMYITGSPPIYQDPWNVTKLLGGYKLSINGTVRGVGPGRTSCGPLRPGNHQQVSAAPGPGLCTPVQPVDGYDVSREVAAALAAAAPLLVGVASYGLAQAEFGLVPAVQAALHIRWAPEGSAPDTIVGTSTGGGWLALDADALYSPSGNKAPFWYVQPREDVNASCLPPLPAAGWSAAAGSCSACGWAAPAPAPGAWLQGTLPLAGKTTQALSYSHAPPRGDATAQLGPGWFRFDAGSEFQGGVRLALAPGAPVPPGGAIATVQLSSQVAANGSALWNTRAGNHYQDRWAFPAPAGARPEQRAIEHHEYCEFRYAEVIWRDAASGAPLPLAAGADFFLDFWVVRYPYDEEGAATVDTSSPELNAVFGFAANTIKTTTLDFYADSNTRQRSIDCMADDTTAALNHYATTTELAFQRMTAGQIMGITALGYISGNWADWTILPGLNVYNDALFTGDLTFAAQYFDVLLANHTYAFLIDPATHLVHNGDGLSALIDTSGGSDDGYHQSPVNSVVNSWSYLALRSFAKLGRWLGRASDAAALDATADALAAAFQAAMFNGTAICDGVCALTPHTAAHATFYALYSGIVDGAPYKAALVEWLTARTAANGALGMPCGSYPAQFYLGGLYNADGDHGNAAFALLTSTAKHSWLNMMEEFGASVTMECWLPEELDNLSFSHVWSSSPSFTVPFLFFGVTATAPGYAAFTVKPQPGPVVQGAATLPTAAGPIAVAFEQGGEAPGTPASTMTLRVEVPGGTVAKVMLPLWGCAAGKMAVTVDGEVVNFAVEGDYASVEGLKAGEHTIATAPCEK